MFLRQTSLLISLLLSQSIFAQDKLIFAIDLIRHGDRTPIIEIPKSSYPWSQGLGQLTAEGMQQEFQLGTAMRKKYITENHLLPSHYQSGTILVRSSDYDRTLMSAESLLSGLYPPGTGPKLSSNKHALLSGYQPIPIHTVASTQDNLLLAGEFGSERKEFDKLRKKYVFSQPDWQATNTKLNPKYKYWSLMTGYKIKNLRQLGHLGDVLYIRQLHHIPLPKGISPNDAKEIIAVSAKEFPLNFKPREIGAFLGQNFLNSISNYLEKATHNRSKLKYVLFSGHDSTILAVMSALHAPLTTIPPYAANLNFALYENDVKEYSVKVSYNGKPVIIPACSGDICSLSQFTELVKDT